MFFTRPLIFCTESVEPRLVSASQMIFCRILFHIVSLGKRFSMTFQFSPMNGIGL